jgi:hypothetical protein
VRADRHRKTNTKVQWMLSPGVAHSRFMGPRQQIAAMQNELDRFATVLLSGVYSRFDTRFGALFCAEVKP